MPEQNLPAKGTQMPKGNENRGTQGAKPSGNTEAPANRERTSLERTSKDAQKDRKVEGREPAQGRQEQGRQEGRDSGAKRGASEEE